MTQKSYIIFGCSGSGKSTFANYLKNTMQYHHVTTGELTRAEANNKTPRGQYFAKMIETDELIPDDIFTDLLYDNLLKLIFNNSPFVLEGYPQTYEQAVHLLSTLQDVAKLKQIVLVYFDIDPDLALKRIASRLICKNCRTICNKEYHSSKICPQCKKPLTKSFFDSKENAKIRLSIFQKNMKNVPKLFAKDLGINFIRFKSGENYNPITNDYIFYIRSLI